MGWGGIKATPRPLNPRERKAVPILQETGWTQEPVWTGAENFVPAGIRSRDRPARSDSLDRLNYRGPIFAEYFNESEYGVSGISVEVLLVASVPQTSERALICSKVLRLRPLVLLIAVVLI